MKLFLLIAGDSYYPEQGSYDWRECFETREEAFSKVKESYDDGFEIGENHYDWYEIIDLRYWIGLDQQL